jgi:peroxiredoxin
MDSQLREFGFQVIGISPDQPTKIRETVNKHGIRFTLLSDSSMVAAKAFGIAYTVDEKTLKALDKYGVDLQAASGQDHHLLPVPAVFVIAKETIQFEYINPDYSVRIDPDLLIKAVQLVGERSA